jgi:hypothetical protein
MAGYMPAPGGSLAGRFLAGGIPVGAAVGRATQNPAYLGRRLRFEQKPEGSLDPLSSTRYLVSLLRQGAIFGALWAGVDFAWGVIGVVLFLLTRGSSFVMVVGEIGSILLWWAFVIAFLLIPIPAQVSEWKFLVDDKGAARPVVFEHVTYAFRRRNTPVDSIGVRRLSLPGGITRDYLEISRGDFAGYISCFEEGSDLYVGWTYWIRMTPGKYFLLRLERIWHQLTQKADEMHVTLRYESAKSLREAMHSAAREGIDVATGRVEAQGQGIVATLPVSSNTLSR